MKKGFTLIELMIVIAMIAIMLSLCIGAFKGYKTHNPVHNKAAIEQPIKKDTGFLGDY